MMQGARVVASATAASIAPVAPDECSLGTAAARTRNEALRLGGTAAGPPAPVALHLVGCRHTESERARGLCALVIEEGDRIKWTMMGWEQNTSLIRLCCLAEKPSERELDEVIFLTKPASPALSRSPLLAFFCVYASVQGSHTQ